MPTSRQLIHKVTIGEWHLPTDEEVDREQLDWVILRDGGIALYLRSELLESDLQWLRSRQYQIRDLGSGSWDSEPKMHEAIASVLNFPPYYGRNLDALNDCMSEDLAVPSAGGLVLCLRRFDRFASRLGVARKMLNIFARASRHHMLRGRRLLVLIQSDDPRISFNGLAEVGAQWNSSEWLLKDRGLKRVHPTVGETGISESWLLPARQVSASVDSDEGHTREHQPKGKPEAGHDLLTHWTGGIASPMDPPGWKPPE